MPEEEKSISTYAAFCHGDDATGTWLWCQVSSSTDIEKPFYAYVENGRWQLKYDSVARMMTVVETKQMIPGMRLAGIGKVPKAWLESVPRNEWPGNNIIRSFLRTGEYRSVEYFVHDRH
jgi:hypothetical protein